MNQQTERAKSIFLSALDRRPDEISEYLNEKCSNEPGLRERVEVLLEGHRRGDGFAERAIAACEDFVPTDLPELGFNLIGKKIGIYKVREIIGQGGMGVVYAAEQAEPIRRKVALKVIKPGMDSNDVLARFESERQALAVMEHPNIAKILDAGITDLGRPFFAMELIRGVPITDYCDHTKLSHVDRLRLFVDVCHAVQHAHQKGIIHRDIKPSNVLITQVDGKPVVKVIDFGLAKATGSQRLTEKSFYTHFMKFMGTPAYMSPEQAGLSGTDIDTRSDIYSLGVLLYSLLTGDTPIRDTDVSSHNYEEICRIIRQAGIPKPSDRISTLKNAERTTIASQRQIDSDKFVRELRGDLDWIVLKALEKDRNRRYASAAEFADDLERFLNGSPVSAAAPTPWYGFKKFAKRHRTALLVAVSFVAVLILASGVSSVLAIQASRQAERANKQAAIANEAKTKLESAIVAKDDALERAERNEADAVKHLKNATALRKSVEKERDRLVVLNYANTVMRARYELDRGDLFEAQRVLDQAADYPDRGFEWYHLQQRLHPESVEISTEDNQFARPQKVAYAPDGNRVAFCEKIERRVRLFDVSSQTPEEEEALICDGIPVRVAFSHKSDRLAVMLIADGVEDGFEVSVYDAHSLQRLCRLPHRYRQDVNEPGYGFDFSPTANLLATVDSKADSEDFRVRIWDVDSGQVTQEIPVRYDRELMPRLQFSLNGHRIAVSDGRNWAYSVVIDLASEGIIATFDKRGSFSADGEHFVTHDDRSSSIIDLNEPEQAKDFLKWTGRMYDFELSADGGWVAGSTDVATYLWRADTLELVQTLPLLTADIAFSPSGTSLATLGDSFKIWDISNRGFSEEIVSEQHGYGGSLDLAWAPDNMRLVYGGRPGYVEIWNTQTAETVVFRDAKGQPHRSTSVDWSSDGEMIAIAMEEAKKKPQGLGIFDVRTKRRIKLIVDPLASCNDVRFSPDGKWLAARFYGGVVRLWNTSTWDVKTIVDAVPSSHWLAGGTRCSDYSFSPDSRELAVCRIQPRVDFFDVETGELLRSHSVEPGDSRSASKTYAEKKAKRVEHVDHSPDGSSVVVTVAGRVDVLNCQTGAVELRLDDVSDAPVSFTPDGRLMFIGPGGIGTHKRTRLLETSYGTELIRFEHSNHSVFSPDGRQLFVVSMFTDTRPNPLAPKRDDWRMRGGIIYRAMTASEYQRRVAMLNSSPPKDELNAIRGSPP